MFTFHVDFRQFPVEFRQSLENVLHAINFSGLTARVEGFRDDFSQANLLFGFRFVSRLSLAFLPCFV
jgi:hypothetical protein